MRYYITTPIYYVNDSPHIGHAYTSVIADALAKCLRLCDHDVFTSTGTDEHGQKIQNSAQKLSIPVENFVDSLSMRFRDLAQLLQCDFSVFIRTTQDTHKQTVAKIWNILLGKGFIYSSHYAGWYSERDEAFYTESELVNGLAPTGSQVEKISEPSYFFKLSNCTEALLSLYKDNPGFIQPQSRYNEALSFIKSGLHDLSVSRSKNKVNWGIEAPNDPNHTIYVWLDALVNYITALSYPAQTFQEFWNEAKVIHVIGKDILRFHGVYWPAFLMSAELKTPDVVLSHGWWTNDGQKISKSLGNVIDPVPLVEKFGVDQIRYFLLREVVLGSDGNFSEAALKVRINSELADNLGNLIQRTLKLISSRFDSKIPTGPKQANSLMNSAYSLQSTYKQLAKSLKLSELLDKLIALSRQANEYISHEEPWHLPTGDSKLAEILYTLVETIRILAIGFQPFVLETSKKILDAIGIPQNQRSVKNMSHDFSVTEGSTIKTMQHVFKKCL